MKRTFLLLFSVCAVIGLFCACGASPANQDGGESAQTRKIMTIGDTTFNPENAEPNVNPHEDYAGWACIRYGVGETLIRYSDAMEIEPWLAVSWENLDELTWRLTLRDGVTFHSGRVMDAQAVKQCLEHLIETHDRAPGDLMIDRIEVEADGQTLTIRTTAPRPALLNYLGDPYGCIFDVDAGTEGGIVAGTGPYIATDCQSGDHLTLIKNENYWNGTPKIDELTIRTISDGDTLAMALQSGVTPRLNRYEFLFFSLRALAGRQMRRYTTEKRCGRSN